MPVRSIVERWFKRRVVDGLEPAVDGVGVVDALHVVLTDLYTTQRAVGFISIGGILGPDDESPPYSFWVTIMWNQVDTLPRS